MSNRISSARVAGTAIAAFLALSSTSIRAQETPALDRAPAAEPAPAIVLPPVTAALPAPAPVADAVPVVEPAREPRDSVEAPTRTARTVAVRAAARPAAITAAPVTAAPEAIGSEQPVTPEALPAELPPGEPATTATPIEQGGADDRLLAGLAGALGLGAIGLFAATRRRRRIEPDDAIVPYVPVAASADPAAVAPPQPAPLVSPAFTPLARWSEPRVPQAQPADNRALFSNREALLDRMVAAEPDANNPFTSAKGRRRRARLMLQSLESDRWDDAELAPGFDWREMAQAVEERETVKA